MQSEQSRSGFTYMEMAMKIPQRIYNLTALAAILFLMSVDGYMVSEAEKEVIHGCETWTEVDKSGTLYCTQPERQSLRVAEK